MQIEKNEGRRKEEKKKKKKKQGTRKINWRPEEKNTTGRKRI